MSLFAKKTLAIYTSHLFLFWLCSDLYFAFLFYSQPVIMTTFDVS